MGKERQVRGEHGLLSAMDRVYTTQEIKLWRKAEHDVGRPSNLEDFFAAHEICLECRGEGVCMIGWSDPTGTEELAAAEELSLEQLPVYAKCRHCGGTGKWFGK